jgi:predicted AAA+ superfamily ATPase
MMITRKVQKTVELSLKQYPVVGILGSRQVGKTTLARAIQSILTQKSVYLDLELPSDLSKLQDPELYMGQFRVFPKYRSDNVKNFAAGSQCGGERR